MVDITELMETRSSQGYVKDFGFKFGSDVVTGLKPADIHYDILLDMFRNDPVLSTAIDITVDAVTNNSFKFIGDNDRLVKETTKLFFEVYDFDRVLDNIIYSLLIYGDSFLEIREESGKPIELHPLETSEMHINYDEHGEVTSYMQIPPGKTSTKIVFSPDSVIHFRLKWIGSRVYSYNPCEPIAKSFSTKIFAYNYLSQIFENLPPKLMYILNSASDDQKKEFVANLRKVKTNPHEDIVIKTSNDKGFDTREFQVKFDTGLVQIIEHLRKEVLMIHRVPPIWVGMIQEGNRSTAEALIYPFELRVRKLQHILSSDINKFLLPKLGIKNLEFRFNPIAFSSELSILQNAQIMKTLGLEAEGEHPIVYYLKQKGIEIPNNSTIPSAEEMMQRESELSGPQIQSDSAPSRQRENKQTNKMTSNLNEKGVSSAGKEKLDKSKQKVS